MLKHIILLSFFLTVWGVVPTCAEVYQFDSTKIYIDEIPTGWNTIDFSRPDDVKIDEFGHIFVPAETKNNDESIGQGQSRFPPTLPPENSPVTIFNGITDLGDNGIWDGQRNGYLKTESPAYFFFIFEKPVYGFGALFNSYQKGKAVPFILLISGGEDVFFSYLDKELDLLENNQGVFIRVESTLPEGIADIMISASYPFVADDLMFLPLTVPEPISTALMLIGGGTMILCRRHKSSVHELIRRPV